MKIKVHGRMVYEVEVGRPTCFACGIRCSLSHTSACREQKLCTSPNRVFFVQKDFAKYAAARLTK